MAEQRGRAIHRISGSSFSRELPINIVEGQNWSIYIWVIKAKPIILPACQRHKLYIYEHVAELTNHDSVLRVFILFRLGVLTSKV